MAPPGEKSQREKSKDLNRQKVKRAAAEIIRREGMEQLTMRRLAEAAEVSLRTPYNLFGSKTDVLLALLDDVNDRFIAATQAEQGRPALPRLFETLDAFEREFTADEAFYREVFHGIMTADQVEPRRVGYDGLIALTQDLLRQAAARGELPADVDADALGEHLAVLFMSVLGMWASGFFDLRACVAHVRRAWASQTPDIETSTR